MSLLQIITVLALAQLTGAQQIYQSTPFYITPRQNTVTQVEPTPGSISATLSVQSLNNILQLAAPLAANEIFQNKTFEINYSKKGFLKLYNVEIDSIHTNSVDGFTVRDFSFKPNTNTLVLTVGGVDVDATMIGRASCLWLVKGHFTAFTIKNITFKMEISTTSDDKVHYKIVETTDFHIQDFRIQMKEKIWQSLLDKSHKALLVTFNTIFNRFVPNIIDRKVVAYNAKIANENSMTFVKTNKMTMNFPFNMTMTSYPEFRASDQMIEIHMDGRFIDPVTKQVKVSTNSIQQPRETKVPQKEQFFVHQTTLNSYLFELSDSYNFVINSTNMSQALINNFHELAIRYGSNASCEVALKLTERKSEQAILLDKNRGIVYGETSVEDPQRTEIEVLCASDSSATKELAFNLESNLMFVMNATFNNFIIYHQIKSAEASRTLKISDNIGLADYNFDYMFNEMIVPAISNYNEEYKAGFNLADKYSTVKFVAGLVQKTLLTPYQENEFLFGGFKWISDF